MKETLRTILEKVKSQLAAMTEGDFLSLSSQVQERLLQIPELKVAQSLALYLQENNRQIGMEHVYKRLFMLRKKIFFPHYNTTLQKLEYFRVHNHHDFSSLSQAFEEDAHIDKLRTLSDLDIMIVPGLLFDVQGRRITVEEEDRFQHALKHFQGRRIGLALSFQVLQDVSEYSPHAAKGQVDWIVTESKIIRCS